MTLARTSLVVAGLVLVAGCAALRGPRDALVPVRVGALPSMTDDLDEESLRTAIERTLPAYTRLDNEGAAVAAQRLLQLLTEIPDPERRRDALARAFRIVRVRDPLLLTAYYEPELDGRWRPDPTFRFAIYARPPDLINFDPPSLDPTCTCRGSAGRLQDGKVRPYPTRAEIEAGALAGRGLELAWTDDPFRLFLLHIQGSGRLRIDGRRVGLRYAGTNGRPYRSLGRTLVTRGLLPPDHASIPDIRRVLASTSETEMKELFATNERYTFFRLAEGEPIGSLGVELTPGRSVATDPRLVPPGALAYVVTPSVRRFVVSQDIGSAVVGAHADLFLGAGDTAEDVAGRMRDRGTLYLLLPRERSTEKGDAR